MNRFEALLAPPTLSGREMAMHVRMQKEVSLSEAGTYRAQMLIPEIRLYDELTTLRFTRPGPDEENTAYRKACIALSGASGTPIPYRFFKEEFDRLKDDIVVPQEAEDSMDLFKPDRIRETVLNLRDPWRIQAYAALCARIALNSETEDTEHAAAAWDMAFSLYNIFFKNTKVEESTTYRQQKDEKFKEETIAAWNGFRRRLVEEIVCRVEDYSWDGRPANVSACIDVLGTPGARAVENGAVDRAVSGCLIPYANAIRFSKDLEEAADLYEKTPGQLGEKDTQQAFARAMLFAMSKEVTRLQADGNSVQTLLQWINRLDVEKMYREGTSLVREAAGGFYEECACYVRNVIINEKHAQAKYADNLAGMIPDDIVIATSGDKKKLHRADVIGLCITAKIRSEYLDRFKSVRSEYSARKLGESVHQEIMTCAMPGLPDARRQELLRHLHQNLLVMLQQSGMSSRLQRAFLKCYDDKQPIVDEQLRTIGGYRRMFHFHVTDIDEESGGSGDPSAPGSIPKEREGLKALADFTSAFAGSSAQRDALRRVIDYALKNPKEEVHGEKYIKRAERCCRYAFISCLNEKNDVSDISFEHDFKPTMELAASFLPAKYEFPATGSMSVSLSFLETRLNLRIDSALRRRANKARKTAGFRSGGGMLFRRGNGMPFRGGNGIHFGSHRFKPGYRSKVIAATIKKVLPPFLFWLILTIWDRVAGGLPGPAQFLQMLSRIAVMFCLLIGFALGCLKNKTPHPSLWKYVLTQACLLLAPFTFYKILEFFGRLPVPIWGIVLYVLYGILYVILSLVAALIIISDV